MGLVAGRLADVSSRKTVIFFGVVIWNLAMVGLGMSNVFWQLLLWRLVLGVGQAFTNPASYSLIADYFPPSHLAMATGFFGSAVHLGVGLSLLLAGLLGETAGWRPVFFSLGAVGVCLFAGLKRAWPQHTRAQPRSSIRPGATRRWL